MKAIRVHEFGDPHVMRLEDLPDPAPGPTEVLVRIRAAGVNPADTYIRSGRYARRPALPYTPGSDAAGIVEDVGAEVKQVKPGQRVYVLKAGGGTMGTYAEFTACAASQAHPLPEHVSFSQGAAIGVPYATAYRALFQRAHAAPADTVLVHGASGGVGIAAVQLARSRGMTVIGTAGSDQGLELVRAEGAHHVLDHRQPAYLDMLMALTANRGVDVVLEMLANVNLAKDLSILAPYGRVVVIGSRGLIEIDPRQTMARDAAVLGMLLWNASEEHFQRIHAALVAGLGDRSLKPVVGRELPLAEAPQAHEAVMAPGAHGKIVLLP